MKHSIPESANAVRRVVAKRHNLHVIVLLLVVASTLLLGVFAFRSNPLAGYVILCAAVAVEIAGIVLVVHLDKRLSVALGFVCPVCRGPLYDGRSNRLQFRGECPCCRQFIVDKLA
jgi:hypothetical protein